MKAIFVGLLMLALQGCAAIYSKSVPVEREPFDARGMTVQVKYLYDGKHCTADIVVASFPCRKGTSAKRAAEFMEVLAGYGFRPHTGGGVPDYVITVREKDNYDERSGSYGSEATTDLGFVVLSSLTFGVFPVISDKRPSLLEYSLQLGAGGEAPPVQHASTQVKSLGGIYFLVLGPTNYYTNRKTLLTEHERAVQAWIQSGWFE